MLRMPTARLDQALMLALFAAASLPARAASHSAPEHNESAPSPSELEEVVVTGTHIPGVSPASPFIVLISRPLGSTFYELIYPGRKHVVQNLAFIDLVLEPRATSQEQKGLRAKLRTQHARKPARGSTDRRLVTRVVVSLSNLSAKPTDRAQAKACPTRRGQKVNLQLRKA